MAAGSRLRAHGFVHTLEPVSQRGLGQDMTDWLADANAAQGKIVWC